MEEGCLTDATGRKVSFRNVILVMTSNAGSQVKGEGLGFCAQGRKQEMDTVLRSFFTPEFLGRIDRTVHFAPLGDTAMEAISDKYLRQLRERCEAQGIRLTVAPELRAFLLKKCQGRDGARQLRRLVQTEVEGPLASYLLRCPRKPAKVQLALEEGNVVFYQ